MKIALSKDEEILRREKADGEDDDDGLTQGHGVGVPL